MKRLALVLLAAVAAAVTTFVLVSRHHTGRTEALASQAGSDLAWLRTEFQLDESQFDAVKSLHEAYSGVCAQHCANIASAQKRLDALITSGAATADIDAARTALFRLEEVCNNATRTHIREVAACMPSGQGERFLAMVEPHLASSPHDGARGLSH